MKAVDPGARVVMAGLNSGGTGRRPLPSWEALRRIYAGLDAQWLGRPFDATATHVYTRRGADAVRVVPETRRVMDGHGDAGRSIDVSELAWPASKGRLRDASGHRRAFFAETDHRGMARRLAAGVRALAAQRTALGISGVHWFQWISPYAGSSDAFAYSGLRRAHGRTIDDRPALAAFRAVARGLGGGRSRVR